MRAEPEPPGADPWKSFRGVMAATLILEAIVVLLAIPVVGAVGGGLNAVSLGYLIGLAVLLILLAGLQGRPWAIWVNLGVQAILLAGFAVYPGVGFIGLLFTGVWAADRVLARRGPAASGARAVATGLIGERFCTLHQGVRSTGKFRRAESSNGSVRCAP